MSAPTRIVSLAPSNTEILYALGLDGSVAAVTRFCDYPAAARQKPKIGGWVDVNDDLVKRLDPDLIITSTFVQDRIAGRLRDMKIMHLDPITLADVFHSILAIGRATGREPDAKRLVIGMKTKINAIAALTRGARKVRVYCEEWYKPPTVCGNWIPDLIEAAGGISLCEKGVHSREVAAEEVKDFDPECMIVTWCGFGTNVDVESIRKRDGWEDISAIKEGRVIVFDDSLLNRPGPRLTEGAELLARTMHPELFR